MQIVTIRPKVLTMQMFYLDLATLIKSKIPSFGKILSKSPKIV